MPKRPDGSDGMYRARIMPATLYLPMANPYIIFNNCFFYINSKLHFLKLPAPPVQSGFYVFRHG